MYMRWLDDLREIIQKSKEGKIGAAINLLDIAGTAKKCAEQVHEELCEVSKGNLTDEEF